MDKIGQRQSAVLRLDANDNANNGESGLGYLEPILALMTDAVMVMTPSLDPPGPRIVYVNEAFTLLTGHPRDDLMGKALGLAHGIEPGLNALAKIRRELECSREARGTAECRRKDGSEYIVEWQIVALLDNGGAVHRWVSVHRSVTPTQGAETDQLSAEPTFRLLVENQPDPICRFLPDTTLTFNNRAYADLFHSTPEELTGRRFIDLAVEADRPAVMGHLSSITPKQPSAQYEHRYVSKTGRDRWHLWTTLGYFDEVGAILSYQSVGTDIADRKEAEENLRKLSGAVEHTPSAIIIADAEGRIEYINPAFTAISGYCARDVVGKSPRILKSGTTNEAVYRDLWKTIRNGKVWSGELCNKKKNGDLYWDLVAIAPVKDAMGSITHFVGIQHEITQIKLLQERMAHDATHDALTDLVNRREFERRLERAIEGAKGHGSHHVLCFLDLDQFKLVNDTAGHAAGDELLKQVRGLLKGKFRGRDTLARLGGDEFGLLLDTCTLERAGKISEMVIFNLRDYHFFWEGRSFRIGASIGLVAITAETESTAQAMAQADVACYAAKERGRNQVRVYQAEGAGAARHHSEIRRASALRTAVEEDRFCLYCQPIVPLSGTSDALVRYEILVRMIDADGRLVLPAAFIPAAERYGLMGAIDRWVIRNAFRYCAKTFDKNSTVEFAINLSGDSLNDDSFPDFVRTQFSRSRVPAKRICFEITETAAIQNVKHVSQVISEIRKKGSRFALDDFGIGLSSFDYLKTLPVDYVKIDGRFVRDMLENAVDHAMVSAINEVGHVMGIETIAEFAHNEAILERLRALGVDYAQGYAIGAPIPLSSIVSEPRPTRN